MVGCAAARSEGMRCSASTCKKTGPRNRRLLRKRGRSRSPRLERKVTVGQVGSLTAVTRAVVACGEAVLNCDDMCACRVCVFTRACGPRRVGCVCVDGAPPNGCEGSRGVPPHHPHARGCHPRARTGRCLGIQCVVWWAFGGTGTEVVAAPGRKRRFAVATGPNGRRGVPPPHPHARGFHPRACTERCLGVQ